MGRGTGTIALIAVAGCARITSREYRTDAPVAPSVRTKTVADSLVYTATASGRGRAIHVEVEQAETCRELTTERVHRTTFIERHADTTITSTTWLVAALGVGTGIYGFANADGVAAQNGSTPETVRETAIAAGLLGLGAVAIGLIDLSRSRDSQRDDGIVEGEAHRREYACAQHVSSGAQISVRGVAGVLDATGTAELDMTSVPEDAFDDDLVATVDDKRVPLPISAVKRRAIVLALADDPRSRVAIDRVAKRRAHCDDVVGRARGAVPDVPDVVPEGARQLWTVAHDACDDLWTKELAGELASLDARIVAERCHERMTRVAFALAQDEVPADPDALVAELGELRTVCPTLPHLDDAQRKLAGLVAKHAQQERARAQAEARAQREYLQRAREQAAQQRSWGGGSLVCNDGSLSPSCTCGGSWKGCCSHHGGVSGCSR